MHIDPIAELLTKIKNGKKVYKPTITVQYSSYKEAILKVLKDEGYIKEYEIIKSITHTGYPNIPLEKISNSNGVFL